MAPMPTLFISHGGPNIVLSDTPARHYLESVSSLMPRPKAIVIVSAHFETDGVAVVFDPKPEMIYDFGGFAPELYQMVYTASGDPALAARVFDLLQDAGLKPQRIDKRGYDHGTWTPMKLAFPKADIPIVQVSIDPNGEAAWHYALGQALSGLREEGVLLVGSGHITHNLRAYFAVMRQGTRPDPALSGQVTAFTEWFAEKLTENDTKSLLNWKKLAPFPDENHPSDEHLMPIFFAYGAAGASPIVRRPHASKDHGFFANDSYLFQ